MVFDVTFKRMSETVPQHALITCANIERAIEFTREEYPGCLIINELKVES